MSTWQFDAQINPDDTLRVPPDVAAQLLKNMPVHVVLIAADSEDEADWRRLATEQFLEGYAPGDDIYDQLSGG